MTDQRIDALSPGTFELDGGTWSSRPATPSCGPPRGRATTFPHLCWKPEFGPHGSCRVCTVKVNGRTGAACTVMAGAGQEVQSNTDELNAQRKTLLQMLFVEGNHFCPSCEKSGNCLLQATAYEVGMEGPHFEEFYPTARWMPATPMCCWT
jgi:[NiFe] hydrogenase diaphorase moiety small subunit